jgi:hypothetical protein
MAIWFFCWMAMALMVLIDPLLRLFR